MMKKMLVVGLGISMIFAALAAAATVVRFPDVAPNKWYSAAIKNLAEKGIITGYPDGTFKPGNNVNRAEVAVMLDKLLASVERNDESKIPFCVENLKKRDENDPDLKNQVYILLPDALDVFFKKTITQTTEQQRRELRRDKEFLVDFKEELDAVLDDYGLEVEQSLLSPDSEMLYGRVKVPHGKEYEWMCRLNQNLFIESVERMIDDGPNFVEDDSIGECDESNPEANCS